MPIVKVFRNGHLAPGIHTGAVADLYTRCDSLRPSGRSSRSQSLYCSPTLAGVTRWVRGNALVGAPGVTHEMIVNPDGVWVYDIHAWEQASCTGTDTDENFQAYWQTGIALADWTTEAQARDLDASNWEVLLPPATMRSSRPVSNKRLIISAPDDSSRRDLMWTLETRKASRGVFF